MKKCVVISDSFKGSLSSVQIAQIARDSILRHFPACQVHALPVADGGEGTTDCFLAALPGGQRVEVATTGPFGETVQAYYGRFGHTAVIEMAMAAGLPLAEKQPNPATATTWGVGTMMRHAVENGAKKIVLGLGGSATNDGGCGCAAALGAVFQNREGQPFIPVGGTLHRLAKIDLAPLQKALAGVEVTAMCDVDNPLVGPNGAAHIYAPQKGASQEMVRQLDEGLRQYARVLEAQGHKRDIAHAPGAGAAGGFGAGVQALLGGRLQSGIDTVLDMVDFDALLMNCDMVFTGEGRFDGQSMQGKAVGGIAKRAAARSVPVVVVAGDIGPNVEAAYAAGVGAIFSTNRVARPFEEVRGDSAGNLAFAYDNICRLLKLAEK